MRLLVLALWLAADFAFFSVPQQPSQPAATDKCVVQGRVVDASSGAPVGKAQVLLYQRGNPPFATTTDSEGWFTLANIPAGGYELHASRNGYVPARWMDPSPEDRGPVFVMEPRQRRDDFTIRLSRQGVVFGRVSDGEGEPVAEALVHAIEFSQMGASPDHGGNILKETNDLGEYRIYGLDPGRYAVCVRPRPQIVEHAREAGDAGTNRPPREIYMATCFPNTTDPARAAAVAVEAGEEVRIDMTLLRGQTFSVRGRVSIPANVSPLGGAEIWLSSESGGLMAFEHHSAEARAPEYSFEIRNVRPGSYILKSRAEKGNKSFEAKQALEVVATDVEGIVMALLPGAEVSGKVHFSVGEQKSLRFARVELHGDELYGLPGEMGELHPDGTFRFDNVWSGTYRVTFLGQDEHGSDAGFYVKSASLGGRPLEKSRFQFVAGMTYANLEIWVARSSAVVAGVVSRGGRPTYDALVCLFPDDRAPHSGPPHCVHSDEKGSFRMERALPGKFRLIALEQENDLMLPEEADFRELLEKHGQVALIEEDSQLYFDISTVPRKPVERKQ